MLHRLYALALQSKHLQFSLCPQHFYTSLPQRLYFVLFWLGSIRIFHCKFMPDTKVMYVVFISSLFSGIFLVSPKRLLFGLSLVFQRNGLAWFEFKVFMSVLGNSGFLLNFPLVPSTRFRLCIWQKIRGSILAKIDSHWMFVLDSVPSIAFL